MILYHGSNVAVDVIDLDKCRPYKDFGKGFYLTTIKSQATRMAVRTAKLYDGNPTISVFEFNEAQIENLTVKRFDHPTREWAEFVLNNRSRYFTDFQSQNNNHDSKYEIVIGPVANDDLSLLFRQFTAGLIDIEKLTEEMDFKKLTDQYSFHTPNAAKLLKAIEE